MFPSVARTTKQILHKICILVHVTGHSRLTKKNIWAVKAIAYHRTRLEITKKTTCKKVSQSIDSFAIS